MIQLTDQVAIVTGGSRGIGLAIARALVAQGVHVAITGRDEGHLSAARGRIESAGPGAVETLRADVRDYAETERVVAATVARFGGPGYSREQCRCWTLRQRRRHDAGAVVRSARHEPYGCLQRVSRGPSRISASAAADSS